MANKKDKVDCRVFSVYLLPNDREILDFLHKFYGEPRGIIIKRLIHKEYHNVLKDHPSFKIIKK